MRDFVGYGAANDFETAAAPGLSNTTADLRGDGAGHRQQRGRLRRRRPEPAQHRRRDRRRPTRACPACASTTSRARRTVSPQAGVKVADVPGVVTAVSSNGFWFQDPTPDADPATSEGLFVFTRTAPTAAVGDAVTVTGTVAEFRPGGAATNLTHHRADQPGRHGHRAPAQAAAGADRGRRRAAGSRRRPVIEDDATGDVETTETAFDPANDGLDFWESLEGMRVCDHRRRRWSARPTSSARPSVVRGAGLDASGPRAAASCCTATDPNPERIVLAPTRSRPSRGPTSATRYAGADGRRPRLQLRQLRAAADAWRRRWSAAACSARSTAKPTALQLAVATFNVENLAPTDPQTKFDRLAAVRRAQPAVARHPGAGGDPGQQRRHRRRRGRGRPDDRPS